jgi:hypothetical protein
MDPHLQLAFEFASDLSKQLITLSTGIIVISITFTKEILRHVPKSQWKILGSAWTLYLVSVTFGVFHLMALTGGLDQVSQEPLKGIPRSAHLYSAVQVIAFLIATAIVIWYGIRGLRADNKATPNIPHDPE